jgi:hemerythrin
MLDMLIEWQDGLLVGFEAIDQEHRDLVSMINQLYDQVRNDQTKETIENTLFTLADQVAAHFTHEDELMRTHGYPHRASHLLEHRKLIDQLDTLLDGIDLLTSPMLLNAIGFMDHWFTDHVVNSDARLGEYLRDHGGTKQ